MWDDVARNVFEYSANPFNRKANFLIYGRIFLSEEKIMGNFRAA
jgi:hypothetical protein